MSNPGDAFDPVITDVYAVDLPARFALHPLRAYFKRLTYSQADKMIELAEKQSARYGIDLANLDSHAYHQSRCGLKSAIINRRGREHTYNMVRAKGGKRSKISKLRKSQLINSLSPGRTQEYVSTACPQGSLAGRSGADGTTIAAADPVAGRPQVVHSLSTGYPQADDKRFLAPNCPDTSCKSRSPSSNAHASAEPYVLWELPEEP